MKSENPEQKNNTENSAIVATSATALNEEQLREIIDATSFLKEIKIVPNAQLKLETMDTTSNIPGSDEIMKKYL